MKKKTSKDNKYLESGREMLKGAKKKYLLASFKALNKFAVDSKYTVRLTSLPVNSEKKANPIAKTTVCDISIKKSNSQLGFEFNAIPRNYMDVGGIKYPESYGLDNELILTSISSRKKYKIEKNSIKDFSITYSKKKQNLSGKFFNLKSNNFSEETKSFWRLIVPVSQVAESDITIPAGVVDHKRNHMVFDHRAWDLQNTLIGIRLPTTAGMFVKVTVKKHDFDFFMMTETNPKALIIDSNQKLTYHEFRDIGSTIRTAFGFLTGKCYRDEAYYVSSLRTDFQKVDSISYEVETPTIISSREIVNHSSFFEDFRTQKKEFQEENRKYHRLMPEETFSKLCEEMLNEETFHRTIEMILSATSSKSPITQGALYSVAIETMTNIIKEENPKSVKVITNTSLTKKLKKELIEIITSQKNELTKGSIKDGFDILISKINQINDAPNSKKLTIPFDLYKIDLDTEDIEAIKNRNKYLHGKAPLDTKEEFELELIALRLHFLIGCLILKYIGYEGHVMNLPVWHYFGNKNQLNELLSKLNFDQLTPLSGIKKMQENGENEKALTELKKLSEAFKIEARLNNAIKII